MASVSYRSVTKTFGQLDVVHDVDVEVADGEFVVFVGPSGCGKSTLLRMLAGLEDVSSGEILIDGLAMNGLPPKDRDVAMVFQNYALYPHMTVAENIGFPLRIQRAPATEKNALVKEAARLLELEEHLCRYPRELSGGQRQRVAMGRALVRQPAVFLFDEPLSNLDATLRVQMRKEIKTLHMRLGATMIYVTHDQVEAMTMADKIVVLRDGRVEQVGAPLDVYHHPANIFVASFVGSPPINLIDCRIEGGEAVRRAGGERVFSLQIGPIAASLGDGAAVQLGVRPEEVLLTEPSSALRCGRVTFIELSGQESVVSVDCAGTSLTATLRGTSDLSLGDEVGVELPANALHFFDASGRKVGKAACADRSASSTALPRTSRETRCS